MTGGDVARVCRAAPRARVVAVHMEAINHCLLSREELAREAEAASVKVEIPEDGETITLA